MLFQTNSHKTKEQRQQEAKERKRKYLDRPESYLREAVVYAGTMTDNAYALGKVDSHQRALETAYVEAGYSKLEAEGMARSVANGGTRESWLL